MTFYSKAFSAQKSALSLNETQHGWLLRQKKERGLWDAIKQRRAVRSCGSRCALRKPAISHQSGRARHWIGGSFSKD